MGSRLRAMHRGRIMVSVLSRATDSLSLSRGMHSVSSSLRDMHSSLRIMVSSLSRVTVRLSLSRGMHSASSSLRIMASIFRIMVSRAALHRDTATDSRHHSLNRVTDHSREMFSRSSRLRILLSHSSPEAMLKTLMLTDTEIRWHSSLTE